MKKNVAIWLLLTLFVAVGPLAVSEAVEDEAPIAQGFPYSLPYSPFGGPDARHYLKLEPTAGTGLDRHCEAGRPSGDMGTGFSGSAASEPSGPDCIPPGEGDWPGLRKDTAHIIGFQIVSVAILWSLPESVTNWTAENKKWSLEKWVERLPKIHMDHDSAFFNYVQHPYWGAGYFVRARERGFDPWGSFFYSASMSTFYEYAIEGQFERPSWQDLIATPVIGSLAGLYFMHVRTNIKTHEDRTSFDRVILAMTDPFGSLENLVDGVLGIKSKDRVRCDLMLPNGKGKRPDNLADKLPSESRAGRGIGLSVTMTW